MARDARPTKLYTASLPPMSFGMASGRAMRATGAPDHCAHCPLPSPTLEPSCCTEAAGRLEYNEAPPRIAQMPSQRLPALQTVGALRLCDSRCTPTGATKRGSGQHSSVQTKNSYFGSCGRGLRATALQGWGRGGMLSGRMGRSARATKKLSEALAGKGGADFRSDSLDRIRASGQGAVESRTTRHAPTRKRRRWNPCWAEVSNYQKRVFAIHGGELAR